MTYKENIRAILECHFTGFKEDIIDSACNRILEQEPRWIPTSERDPRPDDEYKLFLVTDDKGKVSVQEFYLSLDEEPQPYFSGMTNVVAWMPLPEPYKPQESEDEAESEDKE